jgi:FkbM family methyltransferase
MKQVYGWWFPDWEQHFQDYFKSFSKQCKEIPCPYQKAQRDFALQFVKKHRKIIDVGGNVGTWSHPLSKIFAEVHAFEPHPENRECFQRNMEAVKNYTLYPYALSERAGRFPLYIHDTSCGNISLNLTGVLQGPTPDISKPSMEHIKTIEVEVRTLDSFNFSEVDFIKIDVQGHEFGVLKGATELLRMQSPALVMELATRTPEEIAEKNSITQWLQQFGYVLRGNRNKETVYTKQ